MSKQKKFNAKKAQKELLRRETERTQRLMEKRAANNAPEPELVALKKRKKKQKAQEADEKRVKKLAKEDEKRAKNSQRNLAIAAGVMGGLALILIGWGVTRSGAVTTPPAVTKIQAWYYDLEGGKRIAAQTKGLPPIKVGAVEAVRAYVYSCDGCKTDYIAYLERFTDKGKAAKNALDRRKGHEIKREGDADWVNVASKEGQAILKELNEKCPGSATECKPTGKSSG